MNDGYEHIITENQYQFYKEHWQEGQMFLHGRMINPSFVAYAYQKPDTDLLMLYPCQNCNTNGYLVREGGSGSTPMDECPVCKGTGINLNA